MKYLLLATQLLLVVAAHAQSSPVPGSAPAYRHCALIVDDRYFISANSMMLDYGYRRDEKLGQVDAILDEADKLIRKNHNVIFALDYLTNLGWECFNVTTVPSEKSTSGYITSETRYLFRRLK